jgi:hypothetical protein
VNLSFDALETGGIEKSMLVEVILILHYLRIWILASNEYHLSIYVALQSCLNERASKLPKRCGMHAPS